MIALAAGDPGRLTAGRAIRRTRACAAVFSVVTGPVKETLVLYDHAPRLNDPYDTVVSFAMFFVPLLTLGCAGRVLLRRRWEPVPATRMNLAGIPQLSLLLFIFAISFFLLPFAVETLLRRHGSP